MDTVKLHIQTVAVGNDTTDALGADLWAIAAICYDEGEHFGIHYMCPYAGFDDSFAEEDVRSQILNSGFPYEIVS